MRATSVALKPKKVFERLPQSPLKRHGPRHRPVGLTGIPDGDARNLRLRVRRYSFEERPVMSASGITHMLDSSGFERKCFGCRFLRQGLILARFKQSYHLSLPLRHLGLMGRIAEAPRDTVKSNPASLHASYNQSQVMQTFLKTPVPRKEPIGFTVQLDQVIAKPRRHVQEITVQAAPTHFFVPSLLHASTVSSLIRRLSVPSSDLVSRLVHCQPCQQLSPRN
ncbi:hypothetical protein EVAR_84563_1 [Eumeta japonica]|uniref:Uncharacterized protein n=1 Tax=Eumeta variegata TaxID=151549 RepID=A0A4C1UHP3_EUMVA|nr:hypothetical protein EVAR_84563_1 [Eumeta japonica]